MGTTAAGILGAMSGENAELIRRVYELGLDLHVLDRAFDEYLSEGVELRLPAVYPDATRLPRP